MTTNHQVDLYKAAYLIRAHVNGQWTRWTYQRNATIDGLGRVEMVHKIHDDRTEDRGEPAQGSSAPAGLVFRVITPGGGVAHFAQYGEYDSYGDETYNGDFVEVEVQTRTVETYVRTS